MNNTHLNLCLRITCGYRLAEAAEVIHTRDQDILDATVFEFTQDTEPELLTDPHAQYVLVTVQIDANHHICCLVDHRAVLLDFEMNGIQKYNGIHALQRPAEHAGGILNVPRAPPRYVCSKTEERGQRVMRRAQGISFFMVVCPSGVRFSIHL